MGDWLSVALWPSAGPRRRSAAAGSLKVPVYGKGSILSSGIESSQTLDSFQKSQREAQSGRIRQRPEA